MTAAGIRALRRRVAEQARVLFEPPPAHNTWQWADERRVISARAGAVEPGPWHTDRVPYLREIMESLDDPSCTRVVFAKSSQVGGTEVGLNWIGKTIDIDPKPMLVLFPTDGMLKTFSKTFLDPLLEDTPALRGRVIETERRDKRNTVKLKLFTGGYFAGLSARSLAELKTLRAPFAIAEEVDGYDAEVRQQGDPVEHLERAIRTFLRVGGKLYLVSTPADEETSRIWPEFEASDQRRYHLPCPKCGHEQTLRWRDEQGRYRLIFQMSDDGKHVVPGSTRYLCERCEQLIDERHKTSMLLEGRWVAAFPGRPVRGFHIWSAYSPFVTWDAIAEKFLQSRKLPPLLKTFQNLWLGLPFRADYQQASSSSLLARVEPYGDAVEVPQGVGLLTAAIDVHEDRLDYLVDGWGDGEESWVVDWNRVDGDTGQDDVYDRAALEVFRPRRHASGAAVQVAILAIDTGFKTTTVWKFIDRWRARGHRIIGVVGKEGRGRPLIQRPGLRRISRSGKDVRPPHLVGTDEAKTMLLQTRARIGERGPGYMHFPDTLDPIFFDQLTAERYETVYVNRRPVRRWMPIPNRENHALDLKVYSLAALYELGPRVIGQLGTFAEKLKTFQPPAETRPAPSPAARPQYGTISSVLDGD